jgi:carbon monoxide dehydrogenase subunit G
MRIENEFTVAAPPEATWAFLLDVERVAPCMPGAELTETVDATHWKGKVSLKFGPVAMAFAGTVEMTLRDDGARRVEMLAKGTEARGKGAASATIASWVEPHGDGSIVRLAADITMTGAVAQLSRGLLPEVSKQLTAQFADRLRTAMGGGEPSAAHGNTIDALGLGVKAVGGAIAGMFRRAEDEPA